MKFGKQIQKRQLEVPEYAASFVNYKALKKLIKKLAATSTMDAQNMGATNFPAVLQANKATFFFQLEGELEKVNGCYLQKEAELRVRLKTLLDKKKALRSRSHGTARRSAKFSALQEGFQQFAKDLNKLQQFVDINGTAISKMLKKWDKTSKCTTKELYLSRAVEVQPFFNPTIISELSDQATTSLQELGAWAEGDNSVSFEAQRPDQVMASQHLVGTDEGDADTLLLDTVLSGDLDSLRGLLRRMRQAADDVGLMERVTRSFLASIHEGPLEAVQVLLESGLVDLQFSDDINERNCLHQAAIYDSAFILQLGLANGVDVGRTDVYGRVPLHYASMHGRLEMLEALLAAAPPTINLTDHDNFTPLIHAIIQGHHDCVERLLRKSARVNPAPFAEAQNVPLNLGCAHGSVDMVELLLEHGARTLPDAEGLYAQHLVARLGQTPELLLLLQKHRADLDQPDRLYGWTPLVHAASEGNVPCLQTLLGMGADPNIADEKGLAAIYYAAWEGHLECIRLLAPFQRNKTPAALPPPSEGSDRTLVDADAIPALELPPPIIPLRRYGHHFLASKTVVQISFDGGDKTQPLVFFHDTNFPAARLTLSSKMSDLMPNNIMLPFQEDTRFVAFQIDNLDSFTLDFDVFPMYGAKVIAKTVALPSTFAGLLGRAAACCLPLFDPRLRVIGQISFRALVIEPFSGKALGMTDFETYWKATSQLDAAPSSSLLKISKAGASQLLTGSSLSGDFVRLYVQHTSDGVPVLWPGWTMPYGAIDLPIAHLSLEQFVRVAEPRRPRALEHLAAAAQDMAAFHSILATSGVTLQEALSCCLPPGINVNVQILYPAPDEEAALRLGPAAGLNAFVDSVLSVVFEHACYHRILSPPSPSRGRARNVVFSSYNPSVCAAVNWKQPNFPVFLCNDLGITTCPDPRRGVVGTAGHGRVQKSGARTCSIKEMVRTARANNLMGLMCSGALLDMVPALVGAIKSQGLALVVDRSAEDGDGDVGGGGFALPPSPPAATSLLPKGVDGVLKRNGVLRFTRLIDV